MKTIPETTDDDKRIRPVEPEEMSHVEGGLRITAGPVEIPIYEPPKGININRCETFLTEPADGRPKLQSIDVDEQADVEGGRRGDGSFVGIDILPIPISWPSSAGLG